MKPHYDVIIIGNGIVGNALACALGTAGITTAVVGSHVPRRDWPENLVDLRVYAITRASQAFFTHLQVWSAMQAAGISAFRHMHVWDVADKGEIQFDAAEVGEPYLGHIVEDRVIQQALSQRLTELPAVELFCPATCTGLDVSDKQVGVNLQDGSVLQGNLVVGADGAESHVREWADIQVARKDYRQQGLVAVVSTAEAHQDTAWQRFLPTGPLAFLPLRDGRSSIVWSTSTQAAQRLQALDEKSFCNELSAAFAERLGAVLNCGERAAFPLQRMHAETYCAPRVALVGDAAHVIHPLAGQGVNLGLLDAAALAQIIVETRNKGRDVGGETALRRYARWRRGDNLAMLAAMDGLKNLFAADLAPVRQLRNLGLDLVNRAGPVKEIIMRHAMGFSGDLPQTARQRPVGS